MDYIAQKGEVLVTQGSNADRLLFIVSGTVRISGKRTERIGVGGVIGAVPFFNRGTYEFTAVCETECKVTAAAQDNILNLIQTKPMVAYLVMKQLAEQVVGVRPKQTAAEADQGVDTKEKKTQSDASRQIPSTVIAGLKVPKEHPDFSGVQFESDSKLVFTKERTCPVCEMTFIASSLRKTRLRLDRVDSDFRHHYVDCEPIYYFIWVCPHCLFSFPHEHFASLDWRTRTKAVALWKQRPLEGDLDFAQPRRLSDVFLAYYAALYWLEGVEAQPGHFSNIWLRLMWLYTDQGCGKLAQIAMEKSLLYLQSSLDMPNLTAEACQRLWLIIGGLTEKLGKPAEAMQIWHKVVAEPGGDQRYIKLAQEQILELRQKRKEEKNRP